MRKILFAIAFAVATMPLTFAAQTPSRPPVHRTSTVKRASTRHHRRAARKGNHQTAASNRLHL